MLVDRHTQIHRGEVIFFKETTILSWTSKYTNVVKTH